MLKKKQKQKQTAGENSILPYLMFFLIIVLVGIGIYLVKTKTNSTQSNFNDILGRIKTLISNLSTKVDFLQNDILAYMEPNTPLPMNAFGHRPYNSPRRPGANMALPQPGTAPTW